MEFATYLYAALNAEYGVKITTSNPVQLRQKFYALKRDNPEFEELAFLISPTDPENELWVIKKESKQNAEESAGRSDQEDLEPPQG